MKIEDIKKLNISQLLVIFFNTTTEKQSGNFLITSTFRKSIFFELKKDDYLKSLDGLIKYYNLPFEYNNRDSIFFTIKNTDNINIDVFLSNIYREISIKLYSNFNTNIDLEKEIILSLFCLRGSADFKLNFYSVDIKEPSEIWYNNFTKLILNTDSLIKKLNFNFREFQPNFIEDSNKRNTQIRIDLHYFYNIVSNYIKVLNPYRYNILKKEELNIKKEKEHDSFLNRLSFYINKVLNNKIDDNNLIELRNLLNLPNTDKNNITRNQKIVSIAKEILNDSCVSCKNKYDIKDRTFKMRQNNRYYLEINHVLPFANDKNNFDVLDNLVKLCPACHRALTKDRAEERYQKQIIKQMINSRTDVSSFVGSMMLSDNYTDPVEYVYSKLK